MDESRQVNETLAQVRARARLVSCTRGQARSYHKYVAGILDNVLEALTREHSTQWSPVAAAREFHERRGDVPRGGADLAAEFDRLRQPVPSWLMWLAVWIVAIGSGLAMFWISSGVGP